MRIGIDLGGSKIEIAVLAHDGTIALRERVAAPAGDYGATLRTIADLVTGAEAQLNVRASVGVGIPGTVSPATGLVKNANSTWLVGKPFDKDLAEALARPVRVANDANCFALSEAVDGAGAGKHVVFGVIVGTGVGGGIVVGGRILTGHHAIAGEWGHNPLPWPRDEEHPGGVAANQTPGGVAANQTIRLALPPICYCGKTGCIETYLSGGGLAADHARITGENRDAKDIAANAPATMARYFDRFARSLASVINILDPDIIVLGGGLSNIDTIYDELPARLGAYVFSDRCITPVLRNIHGDSGGVRGAAWLWPKDEG